jgi:hypothetical protein
MTPGRTTRRASSTADDAPPLVGVNVVRPRLRRKRLRLRALHVDTSHAATPRAAIEETQKNDQGVTGRPRRTARFHPRIRQEGQKYNLDDEELTEGYPDDDYEDDQRGE